MDGRFIGGPLDGRRGHIPQGEAAVEVVRAPRSPTYGAATGYYKSPAVGHPAEKPDGTIDFVWIVTPDPQSSTDPEAG
jgi:hypothetical protein